MRDGLRELLRPRLLLVAVLLLVIPAAVSVAAQEHGVSRGTAHLARSVLTVALLVWWLVRRERRVAAEAIETSVRPPTPADVADLLASTPLPDRASLRPLLRSVAALPSMVVVMAVGTAVLGSFSSPDPEKNAPTWFFVFVWGGCLFLGGLSVGLVRQYLDARRIVGAAESGAAPRCAAVVIGDDFGDAVLRLLDGTDGVRALTAGPGNISWLGQGALVVLDGPLDGRMVAVSSAGRQDWACPGIPDEPED